MVRCKGLKINIQIFDKKCDNVEFCPIPHSIQVGMALAVFRGSPLQAVGRLDKRHDGLQPPEIILAGKQGACCLARAAKPNPPPLGTNHIYLMIIQERLRDITYHGQTPLRLVLEVFVSAPPAWLRTSPDHLGSNQSSIHTEP